ncbi:hypothetical protein LLG96_04825 [bacterium]|nr:hypothetical protein [bacterium]
MKSLCNYGHRVLLAFILSGMTIPVSGAADDFDDYNTTDVITHVMQTYSRVFSARGRITRSFESGGEKQSYSGTFAVRKPDHILVEFVGDNHQYVGFDGTTFRLFFPAENKGIYKEAGSMNELERFITGPEPLFGNILSLINDAFSVKLADMVQGNLILKASPKKPLLFNFVLIAVDPKTWTVRAVEHFDRENKLVSQTKFLEFKSIGDSLFFPTKIATSSVSNENLYVESTELSRVQLNVIIEDEVFRIPGKSDTNWILESTLEKNQK